MVREAIEAALVHAVREMGVDGEVPDLELGRAKDATRGDYASSAGLKLARVLRQDPKAVAARLAETVDVPEGAAKAEAAGGYVNFRLTDAWLQRLLTRIGPSYGSHDIGHGERLQVEFGSVNPTGPLHIGHGRGVTLGDSICRVLEFTGHQVQREYYVNSDNTQTRRFGASVYARLHGEEPPEGGYTGDYVVELAEMARHDLPGIENLDEAEAEPKLRMYAIDKMVERIRATVARVNVRYDDWYYENKLWESGLPQLAIERLRESGNIKERDGALWFGEPDDEEEDRVVIRANGQPTYFASDLGYLLSRFEQRGYERVIEVWASDHHGYVPRMKSAAAALGFDASKLVIILHQMVNLSEGKMSKRAGRFVTLDELIDRVGSDAVRYFYLLRSPDTTIDFDLQLAVTQGSENPVYYAQYAHARLSNVEITASERHPRLPEVA
ncbi:MAG TPA: arginine--tRNA ligase, partial [Candidatus Dormibacteraeota bacterium]|nr:arginine--tRNA ligase [Candidatus Dormibacteraeota bacterium]